MADFRRVVTALAVLALMTGFASTVYAQGPAFACTASAAVPPLLRSEGLTELTGDIVLNCTGGTATNAGNYFPVANIQIFLGNSQVTSRILTTGSDAVLLLDDPNTSANPAPISVATDVNMGCIGTPTPDALHVNGCFKGNPIPNAYRGIVSGNSVLFVGIPVDPPGTNGTRIIRVTNVRANATLVGSNTGIGGTPGQILAFVTISGSTSIPVNNPTQIIGFVTKGMDFLATAGRTFSQCLAGTFSGTLTFRERFATAFKVRGSAGQTVPGTIYNTESGLILPGVANSGLADSGTRLRATFANIPAGVSLYVTNKSTNASPVNSPRVAYLIAGETAAYSATYPAVAKTDTFGGVDYNAVAITAGTGTAVWEVTEADSLFAADYTFGVYTSWSSSPSTNSPSADVQGTVSGSYAPTINPGSWIPRFLASDSPVSAIKFVLCRTNLLFPFLVNSPQFDTGIAIANTSKDPFGTSTQAGICTINFYGTGAPAAPYISPVVINAGETHTLSGLERFPNFVGYAIAQCNFQYAHGFAYISDPGSTKVAMGYLALVIPDPARTANPMGALVGGTATGEVLGQ